MVPSVIRLWCGWERLKALVFGLLCRESEENCGGGALQAKAYLRR